MCVTVDGVHVCVLWWTGVLWMETLLIPTVKFNFQLQHCVSKVGKQESEQSHTKLETLSSKLSNSINLIQPTSKGTNMAILK